MEAIPQQKPNDNLLGVCQKLPEGLSDHEKLFGLNAKRHV